MKNIIILFVAVILVNSCSSLKQKDDCNKVLDNEISFFKNINESELEKDDKILESAGKLIKDWKILVNCGKLDSIDRIIFSPKIIVGLVITEMPYNDKITYRQLLKKINEKRNNPEYSKLKETVYLTEKIKVKLINENEWEKDKLILEKIGLNVNELNDFKKFIQKYKNTNTTYGTAFQLYLKSKKKNIKKTSFKFNEFSEYNEILKRAKIKNKSVLLYFKGIACQNCEIMENDILSDEIVKSIIKDNFLAYELIVDSREELKEKYFSKRTGKEIKTVGMKAADIEIGKFNCNYQPFFVIIDKNGNLIKKQNFTESIQEFKKFLTIKK